MLYPGSSGVQGSLTRCQLPIVNLSRPGEGSRSGLIVTSTFRWRQNPHTAKCAMCGNRFKTDATLTPTSSGCGYGVQVCFTAVPANTLEPPSWTSTMLITCLLRET